MLDLFFSPTGRIGCAPWWYATILNLFVVVIAVFELLAGVIDQHAPSLLAAVFLAITACWSMTCVNTKRYQDLGKSGWWCLVIFIPVIGVIWTMAECGFVGGELKDNEYGPGPNINIDEDLVSLPDAPVRDEVFPARNFTPLPKALVSPHGQHASSKPAFGKRA
jgi:uncharacterized membrane protein YhaH (DUF805 family)